MSEQCREHAVIRIVDVPSLALRENLAAHVRGCLPAVLNLPWSIPWLGWVRVTVRLDSELCSTPARPDYHRWRVRAAP